MPRGCRRPVSGGKCERGSPVVQSSQEGHPLVIGTPRGGIRVGRMTVMVHLSDLHLLSGRPDAEAILVSLLEALRSDRERRGRAADLVVVTGDLFDTGTLDPAAASREWTAVQAAIR